MITATPTNKEEYLIRFQANQKITGYGIEGTTQHMPCPFCAAPDWMVSTIIEIEQAMAVDRKCAECGRSAKAIVNRRGIGDVSFEFVQTGGDDPPDWLEPKMRRVEPDELCACGLPLHYKDDDSRAMIEDYVRRLGPLMDITVMGKGTWRVPRHFIALHGFKAADVEKLAERYGFERVEATDAN